MMVDLKCRSCGSITEADDETEVLGMPCWGWWTEYRDALCRTCYRAGGVRDQDELDRRRAAAMGVVELHVTEGWRVMARAALRQLCVDQEYVTSDDLWATGLPRPIENRAAAAIFGSARHYGWIVDARRTVPAVKRGANPVRVWRSLICEDSLVGESLMGESDLADWLADQGLLADEVEKLAKSLLSSFHIEKV